MSDQVTRRAFLAAAGAAGAVWLAADPQLLQAAMAHARRQAAAPPPHRFDALTPEQAADLEAVSMRIFPTDETPGAKEAGVIHFIDKSLSTYAADQKDMMVTGLGFLNGQVKAKWPTASRFSALTSAQQDEVLKSIDKSPFFDTMRFACAVGMFGNASYGGNQDQVGWKLIGFESHGINQPPFGYYDAELMKGG
jgi:hypothetical protein